MIFEKLAMATEATEQLALGQKKSTLMDYMNSIPNFNGETSAVSCTEFLDKLEWYATYHKWDEEDSKFALINRLTGVALRWVKPHREKDFKHLVGILKERFIRKDTPDVALSRFTNFKQPVGMNVQEYYDKMCDLSLNTLIVDGVDPQVAEKSRKAMLHCVLLANLAPEIRKGCIVKNPKTVEEILEYALLEEKALQSVNPFYSVNNDFSSFGSGFQAPQAACAATFPTKAENMQDKKIEELREKLDLLTARIESLVDRRDSEPRAGKSETVVCFACQRPGHVAKDCRTRGQQYFNSRGYHQGRNRGRNFRGNQHSQRPDYGNNENYEYPRQRGGFNNFRGQGSFRGNRGGSHQTSPNVNMGENVNNQANNSESRQTLN